MSVVPVHLGAEHAPDKLVAVFSTISLVFDMRSLSFALVSTRQNVPAKKHEAARNLLKTVPFGKPAHASQLVFKVDVRSPLLDSGIISAKRNLPGRVIRHGFKHLAVLVLIVRTIISGWKFRWR